MSKPENIETAAGASTAAPAARPARLPRRVLVGYGIGDASGAIVVTIAGFYLTAYWLDVARLPAAYVGTIFLIAQLWDAFTDPVVSILADRTRSRWGRKRPWLLFGAIPFGVAYLLQWVVPETSAVGLFVYYLAIILLLRTFFTVVNIPYSALTPDLTRDYDERTRLNQYRFTINIVAGLLAISLHPVLVDLGGGGERGYLLSAAVFAVVIAGSLLVTVRTTYELPAPPVEGGFMDALREFREPLLNRPFWFVAGLFVLSWTAFLTVQANLILYIRYCIGAESQFVGIILTFQVTAIVFLAVWGRVSSRVGKQMTYVYGVLIWIVGLLALFFIPYGVVWPCYVAAALTGAGAAVAYLIPWSLLPDVVDEDAAQTGRRRENLFYGVFVLLQKAGLAIGLAGSTYALGLAGYINPDEVGQVVEQPEAVLLTLRVVVSIWPVAILLLTLPLALRYPISREAFAALAGETEARG